MSPPPLSSISGRPEDPTGGITALQPRSLAPPLFSPLTFNSLPLPPLRSPACLKIHTGVRSTFSPRAARTMRSFCSGYAALAAETAAGAAAAAAAATRATHRGLRMGCACMVGGQVRRGRDGWEQRGGPPSGWEAIREGGKLEAQPCDCSQSHPG